jgi:multimeric flavodoxin WrbA
MSFELSASAPKVLCIAGSPRRRGNSERLLDACAEGVRGAGGIVETLVVCELEIGPCTSCDECSVTGVCVVFDDMTDVYPRLEDADALIVASPVYFSSVPAQLKALYDRCQVFWARVQNMGEQPRSPRRPGAFLVVRGGGDPYGFECAVTPTRSVFSVLGVDLAEELEVEGPDAPDDIEELPEVLARARDIGASIAESARAQMDGEA